MTIKCRHCQAGRGHANQGSSWRPRIAIAGLGCETSMFHPGRTNKQVFHAKRDLEILEAYPWLKQDSCLGDRARWSGALTGHALPGGIVTREAFSDLAGELIARLEDLMPLDGLWYDIHGAMVVEGMDDSEAELLRRIREVVGPDVIISASMDLHGNVSPRLAHQLDLITCYRMAPHEDEQETKQRACRNLVDFLRRRHDNPKVARPLKAGVRIPVLLPGEQTSTRVQPAKRIYSKVPEVEARDGVLDASIWVGYAWADEPRNHAAVVVTGWEEQAAKKGAEELARLFWQARKDFHFVAPTGDFCECLEAAVTSRKRPYFISDSGDNPTAGGSGDVTWTLIRLLRWQQRQQRAAKPVPKIVYASIPGTKAARAAEKAGVGATINVFAGAEVDDNHAGPVQLIGEVYAVKTGDEWAHVEVVVRIGNIFVILTEYRKPYHYEHDFTDLDLDVRTDFDIAIVKIGYLEPELFDMAADWKMALTPGGVNQKIERLGHTRIQRPMWPFDKKFDKEPDLAARMIPPSNEPLSR